MAKRTTRRGDGEAFRAPVGVHRVMESRPAFYRSYDKDAQGRTSARRYHYVFLENQTQHFFQAVWWRNNFTRGRRSHAGPQGRPAAGGTAAR